MVCGILITDDIKPNILSVSKDNRPIITITNDGRLIINTSSLTLDEVADQFLEILAQKINKKVEQVKYV